MCAYHIAYLTHLEASGGVEALSVMYIPFSYELKDGTLILSIIIMMNSERDHYSSTLQPTVSASIVNI